MGLSAGCCQPPRLTRVVQRDSANCSRLTSRALNSRGEVFSNVGQALCNCNDARRREAALVSHQPSAIKLSAQEFASQFAFASVAEAKCVHDGEHSVEWWVTMRKIWGSRHQGRHPNPACITKS
jgi:hypothetical protein